MQPKIWLVLTFTLTNGVFAGAQSNSVAGPTDYAAFSRFITERNIFDPNRVPRNAPERAHIRPTRAQRAAPSFTLVGTMTYHKGMFAFFDGNNADLRKVLSESGGIAGYTVTEVTLSGVTLQTPDKKETLQMKIGEMMRQEGNHWRLAGLDESGASVGVDSSMEESSDAKAVPASTSTAEPNDILKKLMQQREQELK